jgi:hypothetical protein
VTSCNKARQGGDVIDSIAMADQHFARLAWSNMIPSLSSYDPAGHILVDLFNYDQNYVPLDPAVRILVNLFNYDENYISLDLAGLFFYSTFSIMIPIMSSLDPASHILNNLVKHDPYFAPH